MCRKKIIFFTLIVSVLISVNAIARTHEYHSDEKIFKKIDILFLKDDYKDTLSKCRKFLKSFPRSRRKKEVMYIKGLCYLKLDDFKRAKNVFNALIEKSGGRLRQDAHLGLGDAYFLNGEYRRAIYLYKDFLKSYPESDIKSSVYSRMAEAYERTGDREKADIYIKRLGTECGQSVEKSLTKRQFAEVRSKQLEEIDTYSVQVGYFSNFENARKLYQRLLRQKYTVYLQKENTPKGTFYRVRVGRFKSRWKAQRFAKKLRKRGYQTKVYP